MMEKPRGIGADGRGIENFPLSCVSGKEKIVSVTAGIRWKLLGILMLLMGSSVLLSAATVRGRLISDLDHLPVSSAEISLKDNAAVSDEQGYFSLDIRESDLPGGIIAIHHIAFIDTNVIVRDDFQVIMLEPAVLSIKAVQVTATKMPVDLDELPLRASVYSGENLRGLEESSADAVLVCVPGVNILQSSGIYQLRSVISMRGCDGDDPGRSLILLDGVPLNMSDTGMPNLKRIRMLDISQIEVLKGPASSIYGASAMGGVINFRSKGIDQGVALSLNAGSSSYQTKHANLMLSGRLNHKIAVKATGYYNDSKGYIDRPDSLITDDTVPLFLKEKGGTAQLQLNINSRLNFTLDLRQHQDKKGEGLSIEHELGNHRANDSRDAFMTLQGKLGGTSYTFRTFYQQEDYLRVSETVKRGRYTRFDVKSERIEQGMTMDLQREAGFGHQLGVGFDMHQGQVDGGDFYTTSSDTVLNAGKMNFFALYLQDRYEFPNEKLHFLGGLRLDAASFYDGSFYANSPNNRLYGFNQEHQENTWKSLSPRAALRYEVLEKVSLYSSLSKGFRAAPLDNITRTGYMRYGISLANPDLGPEDLWSMEFGADFSPLSGLKLTSSFYQSRGNNFLYYVATGDSLGWTALYTRKNVTEVHLQGAEFEVNYVHNKNLRFIADLNISRSRIHKFEEMPELENMEVIYVPRYQSKMIMVFSPGSWQLTTSLRYKSSQYIDDVNKQRADAYLLADLNVSRRIGSSLKFRYYLNNITDVSHTDDPYRLSPGRTMGFSIDYSVNKP